MTLKELENLKVGDCVKLSKLVDKEQAHTFVILHLQLYYTKEPKYTVRQVMSMPDKKIKELLAWKPHVYQADIIVGGLRNEDAAFLHERYGEASIQVPYRTTHICK